MIHHFARAFAVRQQANLTPQALAEASPPARPSTPAPVRPRPITPWGSPARPSAMAAVARTAAHNASPHGTRASTHNVGTVGALAAPRLRISADPLDARRTVIAGRFAEVCAALDRLVMEQEALA